VMRDPGPTPPTANGTHWRTAPASLHDLSIWTGWANRTKIARSAQPAENKPGFRSEPHPFSQRDWPLPRDYALDWSAPRVPPGLTFAKPRGAGHMALCLLAQFVLRYNAFMRLDQTLMRYRHRPSSSGSTADLVYAGGGVVSERRSKVDGLTDVELVGRHGRKAE
jgi:hypothetical protein